MPAVLDVLYLLALVVLSPWLAWRAATTGRYRRDLAAKLLGRVRVPDPDGRPVAWFHGVSVGEVHLLRQVVRAFRERHPDWEVVVSSTTDTGLAEAGKHFPDLTVLPYPFDFSWACRRAIRAASPRLIVLAESELWPNFLKAANGAGVPVVVINGRMSPRSSRRNARAGRLARWLLFDRVSAFGMQSETYAANVRALGVAPERVHMTGNVKYDGALVGRDSSKIRDLAQLLGIFPDQLVWVAGSTHDPEERIVLSVYGRVRERVPNLRLVLVPRAPERFDEVARLLESHSEAYVRRSALTPGNPARPYGVILMDTMGELSVAWGLATIGFTGGSLNDKRGGQSMIEPAGLGVPVVFGPHTWNFKDAVAGLLEVGAAIRVNDEAELEQAVIGLLRDSDLRGRMSEAGRAFVFAQQGATARTLDLLDQVITGTGAPATR